MSSLAKEQREAIRGKCNEQVNRRSAGSPITARGTIVLLDTLDEMESDRDSWKARAEALERAIKSHRSYINCCACFTCVKCPHDMPYCGEIDNCGDDSVLWQFDEERFSKEG